MKPNLLYEASFHFTSALTDRFPRAGAKLFDSILVPLLGNSLLRRHSVQHSRRRLEKARGFRKIVVLPDIHIGDSIMMQAAVSALRDFFPDAEIDYVVKKTVTGLIEGNPEISCLIPLFTGATMPVESDLRGLKALLSARGYDVCINFNPFLGDGPLFPLNLAVIHFVDHVSFLVWNEFHPTAPNHFLYQAHRFIHDLLSAFFSPRRAGAFTGVPLNLAEDAAEEAERFLKANDLFDGSPFLLYNPDAASPFSRLPFSQQVELLSRLTDLSRPILVGAGHSEKNIGVRLRDALPPERRREIRIIPPTLRLEAYSVLIDCASAFISGDTGPLHAGAARKVSPSLSRAFRNRTAIYCLFGATPARMSGYDSSRRGFLPANQDAPSHAYVAGSPCRNITCANKMYKTCKTVRCFESMDLEALVSDIRAETDASTPSQNRRGEIRVMTNAPR
jgi:ADP-heptose:LPS heptosyltransferase